MLAKISDTAMSMYAGICQRMEISLGRYVPASPPPSLSPPAAAAAAAAAASGLDGTEFGGDGDGIKASAQVEGEV
jgi:hypothetical protein